MNSLVLRIFFHGLIAFMPSKNHLDNRDQMTAYLLKGDCHIASLWFEMNRTSACPETNAGGVICKQRTGDNPWCVCELDNDVKISFPSGTVRMTRPLSPTPSSPVLTSATSADDFSWLVRMANVSGGNPVQIGDVTTKASAEITFGWVGEQACHLDQEGDPQPCETKLAAGCKFSVSAFNFALKTGENPLDLKQPLAEYVMFDTRLLPSAMAGTIFLTPASGSPVELDLGCDRQGCPDLMLSAAYIGPEPKTSGEYDRGDHFQAFYDVAKNPGSLKQRIPFRINVNLSVGDHQLFTCPDDPLSKVMTLKPFAALAQTEDDKRKTEFFKTLDSTAKRAASRIVCPMALFDP